MSDDLKPMLLAGTRVTGSAVHLGTLYGWLMPIAAAADQMRVCILIADFQSPTQVLSRANADVPDVFERGLREFSRASVPVIRESEIPSIAGLAIAASTLFTRSDLRRMAPLRALMSGQDGALLSDLLFPAFMVADILALEATHVLDRPELQLEHLDIINVVLGRGAARFGWPGRDLQRVSRRPVDIRRADGCGAMRRRSPGMLAVAGATIDSIQSWTTGLPQPGIVSPGSDRSGRCLTAWGVWDAVLDTERVVHHLACSANQLSCGECTSLLAGRIDRHLRELRATATAEIRPEESALMERAEANAQGLIRQALA